MKNFILFIFAMTFLISCNRDDENNSTNKVNGEWKLIQGKQYVMNSSGEYELSTIEYISQNIIYNFQTNNKLKVSGGENIGYSNGEYTYEFKNDYLSGYPSSGESKIDLVQIQNQKWTFNSSSSQMILDNSFVDGPTLIFEKK